MNIKYIVAIVVGLASQSFFVNHAFAGSNVPTIGGIWIRDGGVDYQIEVDVPNTMAGGMAIDYGNGDTSDPVTSIHTTKTRYFDHLWMTDLSSTMWASAHEPGNPANIHPVNATTIRAFWDNVYNGYATRLLKKPCF